LEQLEKSGLIEPEDLISQGSEPILEEENSNFADFHINKSGVSRADL
jgi:hypothetical protein